MKINMVAKSAMSWKVKKMKKYKIREGSLAWHIQRAKKPLQVLGMTAAVLVVFAGMSAAAADDLSEAKIRELNAAKGVEFDAFDEITNEAEKVAENGTEKLETASEWESIGEFKLTAYCPCEKCCGIWAKNRPNGIVYTASGAKAEAGKTIAVDPDVIPYGTEVKIGDHTYIAQDSGSAIKGNKIDVYFDSHEAALAHGVKYAEVMVKAGAADD